MSTRPRNEDLPILTEIGDDLVSALRRQERVEAARRNRRRLRRLALATATLFVVVPGAVATRYIWAPDPAGPRSAVLESNRAVQIADGRSGALSWRLSAAAPGVDGLCWQLAVFTPTQDYGRGSSCVAQSRGEPLGLGAIMAEGQSLAFGWLDPQVTRVVVDPGTGEPPKEARVIEAPADRVEAADLPDGTKGYVVGFAADLSNAPPSAVAFDAAGRELGRMPPKR